MANPKLFNEMVLNWLHRARKEIKKSIDADLAEAAGFQND